MPLPQIKLIPCRDRSPVAVVSPVTPIVHDLRQVRVQEFLCAKAIAPNTYRTYQRELDRFLQWTPIAWADLKRHHLHRHYLAYLSEEYQSRQGKSLSPASINVAISTLKSFFGWLHETYPEQLPHDPTEGMEFRRIPQPESQHLSDAEMVKIWDAIDQFDPTVRSRNLALIHVLWSGLRSGEAVSLDVGSIEMQSDRMILTLQGNQTKTKQPRWVPVLPESQAAIATHLQQREDQGSDCDAPLFLSSRTGRRLSYHAVYQMVERLGELTGIANLHPHRFRHTAATRLVAAGMDPTLVQRLLGIRSPQVFKRYSEAAHNQAAIDAFWKLTTPNHEF